MTRPVAAAALALAVLAVLAPAEAAAQGRPASVQVDETRVVTLAETQPVLGRIVASTQSVIATRIPGIVATVFVRVGDRVDAGDPLAELDRELLEIEVEVASAAVLQAEALLNAATANVSLAQQSFERVSQLEGSAAFSRGRFEDLAQELERARALFAEAEGRSADARAQKARADYNLENATIDAPFDGVVIERQAAPGAYVSAGEPIVTLIDDVNLEIEADVPTDIVAALDPGIEVDVTLDDGTRHRARVRAVIPEEQTSTRTRRVRFTPDFSATDKPLAAGQSVSVAAPVGQPREVVSVSKDALVQQAGGWVVFEVADGKAVPRPVRIGKAIGDRFEVLSGIAPGAPVVVRGNERLRPGQPVEARPAGPAVPAAPATSEDTEPSPTTSGAEDGGRVRQQARVTE